MTSIERYLARNGIRLRDLLYLRREEGRTLLCLSDGRRLATHRSVKDFLALAPDQFLSVNKGILVRRDAIVREQGGILTLTDGTQLRLRRQGQRTIGPDTKTEHLARLEHRYAVLKDHPLPHRVYSLPLFDGECGAVLRYQNRAATALILSDEEENELQTTALAVLTDGAKRHLSGVCLYESEDGRCVAVFTAIRP